MAYKRFAIIEIDDEVIAVYDKKDEKTYSIRSSYDMHKLFKTINSLINGSSEMFSRFLEGSEYFSWSDEEGLVEKKPSTEIKKTDTETTYTLTGNLQKPKKNPFQPPYEVT